MVFNSEEGNKSDKVSLQMVDRAVWNVMESKDSATVRERVTQHSQVLFNPVTEKYFKFAIDQRAPDESTKETLRQLAGLVERCRTQGLPTTVTTSTGVSAAQPAAEELDKRLLGHWRSTKILGSGGFTMVTDTHCVLDAGGRFEWWSNSNGTLRGPEHGNWSVSDNTLVLNFDHGTRLDRKYAIEGTAMLWPGDGRYRLWDRIK